MPAVARMPLDCNALFAFRQVPPEQLFPNVNSSEVFQKEVAKRRLAKQN